MIHNFSEIKEQNALVESRLQAFKAQYQARQMSQEQAAQLLRIIEEEKYMNKRKNLRNNMIKCAATAAALIGAFIILPNTSAGVAHAMGQLPIIGRLVEVVTFRDYTYDTDRQMADINVPEIKVSELPENSEVQGKLEKTAEEINAEIQKITDGLIKEFEDNLEYKEGYQDIMVKSEVLATTPDYFTLKLICYQGAGSGYAWNYFYTIDLKTGERLQLKALFQDGADYITPISENIKQQMQAQMDADKNVYYWLHDEISEWNFKAITDETSFYLNERDNVVIGFNEGDVAPMYMGTVEFEIPAEVLKDIRK